MKTTKRTAAFVLALAVALSAASCSLTDKKDSYKKKTTTTTATKVPALKDDLSGTDSEASTDSGGDVVNATKETVYYLDSYIDGETRSVEIKDPEYIEKIDNWLQKATEDSATLTLKATNYFGTITQDGVVFDTYTLQAGSVEYTVWTLETEVENLGLGTPGSEDFPYYFNNFTMLVQGVEETVMQVSLDYIKSGDELFDSLIKTESSDSSASSDESSEDDSSETDSQTDSQEIGDRTYYVGDSVIGKTEITDPEIIAKINAWREKVWDDSRTITLTDVNFEDGSSSEPYRLQASDENCFYKIWTNSEEQAMLESRGEPGTDSNPYYFPNFVTVYYDNEGAYPSYMQISPDLIAELDEILSVYGDPEELYEKALTGE